MPDVTQVTSAAVESSWVAGLLVVLVVSTFTFFGFVLRKILDTSQSREDGMSLRLATLETEVRTELFTQLRLAVAAMERVIIASDRMCAAADRMLAFLEQFDVSTKEKNN